MFTFLARRLAATIPVLQIVAVLVFLMLRLTPGDPAVIIAGDAANPEQVAQIRAGLGLDRPIAVQFGIWFGKLLSGNLGESYYFKMTVVDLIAHRIEPSLALSVCTIVLSVLVSVPLGVLAAWRQGGWLDRALMGFSVLIAVGGILLAHKFYVASPEISDQLAERWAGAHRTLSHKYYVDELYDATVISGTFASGRGLWAFDRRVVDGAVNGTGWVTIISSWFSGLTDTHVVDGVVNLVGRACEEASFWFRKLQTGLVQNYALWMLAGIFAFVSIYLFVR